MSFRNATLDTVLVTLKIQLNLIHFISSQLKFLSITCHRWSVYEMLPVLMLQLTEYMLMLYFPQHPKW